VIKSLSDINTKKTFLKLPIPGNYRSIRSLALCIVFVGIILSSCFVVAATPWVDSTLSNTSYVEQQGWKKLDTNVTVSSTTDDFSNGYLIVNITDNLTSYDALRVVSNGSLNVTGDAVYWESDRIGTIDSTYDGSNGILRIDFTSAVSLPNSGFETGDTTGWIINNSYPGVNGQAWVESPFDDPDVVTGPGTNDDPLVDDHSSVSQTTAVQSSLVYAGSYALKLTIGGTVSKTFGTAHGPMVTSSTFSADEGDNLSVRWYALDGGDWYDVYGFVYKDADNDGIWDSSEEYQKLFHDVGSDTGGWITTNATIASNVAGSNIRFLFLNGNYDNTGGQGIGSSLYIDGIVLNINTTSYVNNTIAENIIENIEFSNSCDAPNILKTYNVTLKESNNDVDSSSATILITPVNDVPGAPGNFTNPSTGHSLERGGVVNITWEEATDPDGDNLNYDLWFYNGTWTQIGNMLSSASMLFTMPSDNVTEGKFKVYANDTLLNSSEINVTFGILDAPEFTYSPEDQEQLSKCGEELNFTIESTLMSGFQWFVDGSPISGSGYTVVQNSNDSATSSYCLINSSEYINDADFFMGTYNISVVASNSSLLRNDTYSWDWTITNSSTASSGDDISFIINGSVNVTSSGNESYVKINTTDSNNTDDNGLLCGIVSVEFNTTNNPSGVILKVEVINKTSINESEAGFSQDSVYQYVDISFNNITLVNNQSYSRNIQFKVLNELNGGNLIINTVALKHLKTGTWETYTPTLLYDDGNYSHFMVYNVTGFSPFAVMASYGSTTTSTTSSSDGLPYYLKKQILDKAAQETTEEVSQESAIAEDAADSEVPTVVENEKVNAGSHEVASTTSEIIDNEDSSGSNGTILVAGTFILFLLLLFILKRRSNE
jgi:hypothetical protein